MKCIKEQCKYYLESDIFETCSLVGMPITDKCVGRDEITQRKEDLLCKIGKLLADYEDLCNLESKLIK